MLPAHRARISFLERSAEASHIEAEGVTWMRHRTSVFLWLHHASLTFQACSIVPRTNDCVLFCLWRTSSLVYLAMLG